MDLTSIEPFEETFGLKAKRKRPKTAHFSYEELAKATEEKQENYDPSKDSNFQEEFATKRLQVRFVFPLLLTNDCPTHLSHRKIPCSIRVNPREFGRSFTKWLILLMLLSRFALSSSHFFFHIEKKKKKKKKYLPIDWLGFGCS